MRLLIPLTSEEQIAGMAMVAVMVMELVEPIVTQTQKIGDNPQTHIDLVKRLENEYDGWAIALTVHSLSTYLKVIETDSRNGIRIMSWVKPIAIPSGSRIATSWEPVIVRVPKDRKGWKSGKRIKDHLIANPRQNGFVGSKPDEWTQWVLDAMGYEDNDTVDDLFVGSGAVSRAIEKAIE